jgi:hypothetical protein
VEGLVRPLRSAIRCAGARSGSGQWLDSVANTDRAGFCESIIGAHGRSASLLGRPQTSGRTYGRHEHQRGNASQVAAAHCSRSWRRARTSWSRAA